MVALVCSGIISLSTFLFFFDLRICSLTFLSSEGTAILTIGLRIVLDLPSVGPTKSKILLFLSFLSLSNVSTRFRIFWIKKAEFALLDLLKKNLHFFRPYQKIVQPLLFPPQKKNLIEPFLGCLYWSPLLFCMIRTLLPLRTSRRESHWSLAPFLLTPMYSLHVYCREMSLVTLRRLFCLNPMYSLHVYCREMSLVTLRRLFSQPLPFLKTLPTFPAGLSVKQFSTLSRVLHFPTSISYAGKEKKRKKGCWGSLAIFYLYGRGVALCR